MKENTAYSPADERRIRQGLRALREMGHTFSCATALAVRSVRCVNPGRCLCGLDGRRDRAQRRHSIRVVA